MFPSVEKKQGWQHPKDIDGNVVKKFQLTIYYKSWENNISPIVVRTDLTDGQSESYISFAIKKSRI